MVLFGFGFVLGAICGVYLALKSRGGDDGE